MSDNTRDVNSIYEAWLGIHFADVREELEAIRDNEAEIRDRFYKELDFGTAGIRGVMGAGTNRMNKYVVRRLSCAIAKHIVSKGEEAMKHGVVIGYDSRCNSRLFAEEAAAVYAGYGVRVYLHNDLCPVPLLSFSVRHLHTEAGVMITASHNPKEYNGYKVYGSDGAQLSIEDSAAISALAAKLDDYAKIPAFNFDFLLRNKKISYVKPYVANDYMTAVMKLVKNRGKGNNDEQIIDQGDSDLSVVYSPLHGAGGRLVPEALTRLGITRLHTVEEQMKPDGNFPTVRVPNPEDPAAYKLALEKAEQVEADIILATDPDADRTGAYARNERGEFEMLNGNQIGLLLLDGRTSGNLPAKPFAVSTIVSTRLAKKLCEAKNVRYIDVLTGFKFIGEQIVIREEGMGERFVFGFEESYGYLAGSYARDKDAVASCVLLANIAAHYKEQGKTLFDALNDIYAKYGAQIEVQYSLALNGETGLQRMKQLLDALRARKGNVSGKMPSKYYDYKSSEAISYGENGAEIEREAIILPKSDVLYYEFSDYWFCLRPSGTEPKIKIYCGASGEDRFKARDNAEALLERVKSAIEEITKGL